MIKTELLLITIELPEITIELPDQPPQKVPIEVIQ
jgi:hypothetical protein